MPYKTHYIIHPHTHRLCSHTCFFEHNCFRHSNRHNIDNITILSIILHRQHYILSIALNWNTYRQSHCTSNAIFFCHHTRDHTALRMYSIILWSGNSATLYCRFEAHHELRLHIEPHICIAGYIPKALQPHIRSEAHHAYCILHIMLCAPSYINIFGCVHLHISAPAYISATACFPASRALRLHSMGSYPAFLDAESSL